MYAPKHNHQDLLRSIFKSTTLNAKLANATTFTTKAGASFVIRGVLDGGWYAIKTIPPPQETQLWVRTDDGYEAPAFVDIFNTWHTKNRGLLQRRPHSIVAWRLIDVCDCGHRLPHHGLVVGCFRCGCSKTTNEPNYLEALYVA